ncbi:brain protein I3-like isoform X2 [Mya arenaria]|uniref:brain protein I3-like isoform X2 n=1 Tax=Mya arenaria TaxID=6604 RepID=UPI0022E4FF36|nr:brain protein I3-like isoform X2 [Mya arenaria]
MSRAPPPYEVTQQSSYGYDQTQAPPQQGHTAQTTTVIATSPTIVVGPGRCGACGQGIITESYTILGIVLAVLFFPLGVICCLMMTERRCGACGATY